jgi:hypothetical protein
MKTKMQTNRSMSFERLEDRTMLAGNVAAAIDNSGNLKLTGDANNNIVALSQAANGKWVVKGLLGTTINGAAKRSFYVENGLKANLGNGNDGIAILKGEFYGNVCVNTGNGTDGVALVSLDVGRNLKVNTGNDSDAVFINNVQVGFMVSPESSTAYGSVPEEGYGKATINTGSGMDISLISKLSAYSICIDTGSGLDMTGLISVCADYNLSVNTGSDFDTLGVVKSKAYTANFNGGGDPANLYASAKNSFGSESNNFNAKLNLDAIADQVEKMLNTAKVYLKSLPGIGNLPNIG